MTKTPTYETRPSLRPQKNYGIAENAVFVAGVILTFCFFLIIVQTATFSGTPSSYPVHLSKEMKELGWEMDDDNLVKDGISVVYKDDRFVYHYYGTIPENLRDDISRDFRISLGIAEMKYESEMKKKLGLQ